MRPRSLFRLVHRALALVALLAFRGSAQQPAADSIAISQVRSRLVAAFRSNTADSLGPIAADNMVFVTAPMAVGRDAFVATFKMPFDKAKAAHQANPFVLYPTLLDIGGDWAFEQGEFGPDDRPPVGTYTWVYHRTKSGNWELAYWGRGGAVRK